jgi:hypothetical protein
MRRRVIAAAALALVAGASCGTGSDADGHFRVERTTRRTSTLLDEPGRAQYCSTDSLLTIIAIGRNGAAGFAVRTTLPLRQASAFDVQQALGGLGTATAAFRLASGAARLGTAGRLRLQPAATIEGEFDVTVLDSLGAAVQFKGRLSRIPLRKGASALCSTV